jgi:putative ABC transport system permease protein
MSSASSENRDNVPRVFSLLVACYSHEFRARFGGELGDVISAVWSDSARTRPLARARLAARLFLDLTLGIVADRLGRLIPPRKPGHGVRRSRRPLPPFLDSALIDVRLALRGLRQHRAFAITVILTLGVGIGGVTAMWSVVYGVLLRPLPYPDSDRLVRVWNDMSTTRGPQARYGANSAAEISAWRSSTQTVTDVAGLSITTRTVEGGDYVTRVPTGIVTENFFEVLGARAAIGRMFGVEDVRDGTTAVVVLSDEMWRTEFGADPGIVGRSIRVNGRPSQIIGVAHPDFRWLDRVEWKGVNEIRLWTTRVMDPNSHEHFYYVIARARPGATRENIALELGTIVDQVERRPPTDPRPTNLASLVRVEPFYEALFGQIRERVILPFVAVLLVLMLACANTANLLLSRLPARRAEMAMRSALGATRGRIIRQLLTESLVLASVAALVGVFVAYWSTRAIAALGPREITRLDEVGVSGVVLLASILTAATCAVVFGLAPAVRGSRVDVSRDLAGARGRSHGATREGGRAVLLAAELAVALVLLIGAMLMTRSFGRLMAIDTGLDRDHTIVARVSLPASRYQEDLGAVFSGGRAVRFRPEWEQFIQGLVRRVENDPSVASASAALFAPILGSARGRKFEPVGSDTTTVPSGGSDATTANAVNDGYFRTLRIPLLEGRVFDTRDRDGSPRVAVVSQSLARQYWPGQSAIGKRFWGFRATYARDTIRYGRVAIEVVGVVADTREAGYMETPIPRFYTSLYQGASDADYASTIRGLQFNLVVRAKQGDVGPLEQIVRREVRALDAQVPVSEVRSLEWVVNEEVRGPRFYAFLLSLFGGFALVLATAGVFGVLAFTVSQRTHEIGIRMALGAQAGAVIRLIVRQVVVCAAVGVVSGVAISAAATRFVRGLVFGIEPTDPTSMALAVALLLAAACLAAWVPARRAVRVDPALALRAD